MCTLKVALLVIATMCFSGARARAKLLNASSESRAGTFAANSSASTLSPTLPDDMAKHTFAFVVGIHHSGTTVTDMIIGSHPQCSKLSGTHVAQDEGQHLQHVYPPANRIGKATDFHLHPLGWLTETSDRLNDLNRRRVYDSWRRFWDLSKPVLVEKSPRHVTMTRFLQAMFTPDHSRFVGVLRHPLGAHHHIWLKRGNLERDCGANLIKSWLEIHEILVSDVKHLSNIKIFQIERLLEHDKETAERMVASIYAYLKLNPNFGVDLDDGAANNRQRRDTGRKLLMYHGGSLKTRVHVQMFTSLSWADDYLKLLDTPQCKVAVGAYEEQVNRFGYSLKDPRNVTTPTAFKPYLLDGAEWQS